MNVSPQSLCPQLGFGQNRTSEKIVKQHDAVFPPVLVPHTNIVPIYKIPLVVQKLLEV